MLYKDWYEIFKIKLHFMKIKFYEENKTEIWVQVEVSFVVCLFTQSCPTLCDPLDCSPPGSSVHRIFQQEYWSELPFPSSRDLPNPRTEPLSLVSWTAGRLFTHQGNSEAQLPWRRNDVVTIDDWRANFLIKDARYQSVTIFR